MQHSIHSIKRAFTFQNNFHANANRILSRVKRMFTKTHFKMTETMKKLSNQTKCSLKRDKFHGYSCHPTNELKGSLEGKNLNVRNPTKKQRVSGDLIFVGVHVRYK